MQMSSNEDPKVNRRKQLAVLLAAAGWVSLAEFVVWLIRLADAASYVREGSSLAPLGDPNYGFLNALYAQCARSPWESVAMLSLPALLVAAILFWWFGKNRT